MPDSFLLLPADPRANYLAHKAEIDQAIHRVLDSGVYILGEEVAAFEQELARYLGVRYAIGVGCGTDALHLALRACAIGSGDAVMTVSHTAVATVAAIELAGATPLLVDIDPRTFTMDPNSLEDAIRRHSVGPQSGVGGRLRAIIPVHLYGHPADMPAIMDIARRYSLYVIEDCAQSHGAAIGGRKTGTWGHMAAFSFYPTKNLGALGDGGALVTNDPRLHDRARQLREYGWRERYISHLPGMNTRLDELHAAVLRVKLQYLDEENARRRQLARRYHTLLADTSLTLPLTATDVLHVYHQYVVRSLQRDALRSHLSQHGIGTLVHYPLPVHLQPAYRGRIPELASLRRTELIVPQVLSMPMHPQLDETRVRTISQYITSWDPVVRPSRSAV